MPYFVKLNRPGKGGPVYVNPDQVCDFFTAGRDAPDARTEIRYSGVSVWVIDELEAVKRALEQS